MAKQAILISCHKNPKQVNMLLKALNHPDLDIYVHVDKKSNMEDQILKRDNVFLLPKEFMLDVGWGSLSQVKETLLLLSFASQNGIYEHYWNCSGQDFPIKSTDYIARFLHSKANINFLGLVPSKNWGGIIQILIKEHPYIIQNGC